MPDKPSRGGTVPRGTRQRRTRGRQGRAGPGPPGHEPGEDASGTRQGRDGRTQDARPTPQPVRQGIRTAASCDAVPISNHESEMPLSNLLRSATATNTKVQYQQNPSSCGGSTIQTRLVETANTGDGNALLRQRLLGLVILTPLVGYLMGYWWGFGVALISILVMTGVFDRKKDMEEKNEDLARRIARNIGSTSQGPDKRKSTPSPSPSRPVQSVIVNEQGKQERARLLTYHRGRLLQVIRYRIDQLKLGEN